MSKDERPASDCDHAWVFKMQASRSTGTHFSKYCQKCFDVKPMTDFDKVVFFVFGLFEKPLPSGPNN